MKIIPHDADMVESALALGEEMGSIRNSITRGKGNAAGKLGEIAFAKYIQAEIKDCKDFDLEHGGKKLEVKTKRRTVKPRPDYDVSVAVTSTHQNPDRYVFISLEFDSKKEGDYFGLKNVWLCGDKSAKEYMEQAFLHKMGSVDWSNGFKTIVDMWNMRIHDLDQSF